MKDGQLSLDWEGNKYKTETREEREKRRMNLFDNVTFACLTYLDEKIRDETGKGLNELLLEEERKYNK